MVSGVTKPFYNTILCQTFSPCGKNLIVGDIYGTISIFRLSKLNAERSIKKSESLPISSFTVEENVQINSLIIIDDYLVVGTVGQIYGYRWSDIKHGVEKPKWCMSIPVIKDTFDKSDVNCLIYFDEDNALYAGCGDNNIFAFDIETGKNFKVLKGHQDYVHCMSFSSNRLVSGGEDGSVLLWDMRGGLLTEKLEPHSMDKLKRPNLGKWIGAVCITPDWLLCGGGPRLSLWHLRSLNTSTVFSLEDKGIHVAEMYQDKIFAGGQTSFFYQMNFNGDVLTEIPISAVTTYSAIHQEAPYRALCIAGSSPKIDVCSNFIYKTLQLSLY